MNGQNDDLAPHHEKNLTLEADISSSDTDNEDESSSETEDSSRADEAANDSDAAECKPSFRERQVNTVKNESEDETKAPQIQNHGLPQELSIQWLNLNRVPNVSAEKTMHSFTLDDLSKIVDEIIKMYNKKNEETGAAERYDSDDVNSNLNTGNYKLKTFKWFHNKKTILSRKILTHAKNEQKYTFILFFYNVNPPRIITGTTGSAYNVVTPYVDYTFPKRVAIKVGESSTIKSITKLCIFGNCTTKIETYSKKSPQYKTSYLYNLISSLTCGIKPDSCLYQLLQKIELDRVQERQKQPSRKQLQPNSLPSTSKTPTTSSSLHLSSKQPRKQKHWSIVINNGGVRIKKKIKIENYLEILDIFTEYMKQGIGELDDEIANSGFEFLFFYQKPHLSKNKLDEYFMEEIFESHKQQRQSPGRITYNKNLDDFLYSEKFSIEIGSKEEELQSNPPDMEEVLNKIMDTSSGKDNEMKEFQSSMITTKLVFTRDTKKYELPLLDCIEGEYRHREDATTYFKIRNMWYTLNAEHSALLQKDFVEIYSEALILKESEPEGCLPVVWKTHPTKLTKDLLLDALNSKGITKTECKEIIDSILKCEVCYVDGNIVKLNRLVGNILSKDIFSNYKEAIEAILSESEMVSETRINEMFPKEGNDILSGLREKRKVLEKRNSNIYVLNPFLYPLKQILEKNKYKWAAKYNEEVQNILEKLLNEIYQNSLSKSRLSEEWDYNSTYLRTPYGIEKKYLVFDKITPDGIEACDILRFTDKKVYLYQVKDEFGQHSREACSQILNAATFIHAALRTMERPNNYLKKLWTEAKKHDNRYGNQMESLTLEQFINIFWCRKLVFVYAYCPLPSHNFSGGVRNALSEIIDPYAMDSVIGMLIELKYLNSREQLTHYLASAKQKDFKLQADFKKRSKRVYEKLRKYYNFCNSSIAKLEIVRLAPKIQALGYEFKICEITKKMAGFVE